MPWLSPSIKLIETFLESKRNEPLPPTLAYISLLCLSFLPHPIPLSLSLSLSLLSIRRRFSLSHCRSASSVSGSTFSFAFTPHSLDRWLSPPPLSLTLCLSLSLPPSIWRCAIRPSLLRPPLRFFLGAAPPCSNPYRKPDVDASVASLRSGVLLLSIRIAACFSIEISRGNFLYELCRALQGRRREVRGRGGGRHPNCRR